MNTQNLIVRDVDIKQIKKILDMIDKMLEEKVFNWKWGSDTKFEIICQTRNGILNMKSIIISSKKDAFVFIEKRFEKQANLVEKYLD